jgi:excisionase family DNA binding protein
MASENGLRPQSSSPVRLALSLDEAAATLGVSRDYFDEHIRPELRVVRRGRRVLVAVAEVSRWLDTAAARAVEF